ncbi:MAG: hypothetical protein QM811_14800 [Pirellulales bacterium]
MIQNNLKPGERVIISGLQRVRPGIAVNAKPGKAAATSVPGDAKAAKSESKSNAAKTAETSSSVTAEPAKPADIRPSSGTSK